MPPAYDTCPVLAAQLRMLATTTDPLRWRLAHVQASTRLAAMYGLRAVRPPNRALQSADVVIMCANAALDGAPAMEWLYAFCT